MKKVRTAVALRSPNGAGFPVASNGSVANKPVPKPNGAFPGLSTTASEVVAQ